MANQESGGFVCSRMFTMIICGVNIAGGVIFIFSSMYIAINPEKKVEYTTRYALAIFTGALVGIGVAIVGLYGAIKKEYMPMLVYAMLVSLGAYFYVMHNVSHKFGLIYGYDADRTTEDVAMFVSFLLQIPVVICAWIVVSGLQSSSQIVIPLPQ